MSAIHSKLVRNKVTRRVDSDALANSVTCQSPSAFFESAMADQQTETVNQINEPVAQVQDIMNPATFVPPDSQPTPRVTIEFCDRVRELPRSVPPVLTCSATI